MSCTRLRGAPSSSLSTHSTRLIYVVSVFPHSFNCFFFHYISLYFFYLTVSIFPTLFLYFPSFSALLSFFFSLQRFSVSLFYLSFFIFFPISSQSFISFFFPMLAVPQTSTGYIYMYSFLSIVLSLNILAHTTYEYIFIYILYFCKFNFLLCFLSSLFKTSLGYTSIPLFSISSAVLYF